MKFDSKTPIAMGLVITIACSIAPAFIAYGSARSDISNLERQIEDIKHRQEVLDAINTRLSRIEGALGVHQ